MYSPKQLAVFSLFPLLKTISGFNENDFVENVVNYDREIGFLVNDTSICIYYNLKNYVYVDWTIANTFREKRMLLQHLKSFNKPLKIRYSNKNLYWNHTEPIVGRYYWLKPKDM